MQQTVTITATMAAYPALPASPTLTNPDMILPYGEYDSTPSPPRRSFRPEPDGDEWRGPAPSSLPFSIGPPHTPLSAVTPITPIIYGNGTMLSDIGEVTEAESTPGRKLPGPAERRLLKQAQGPLRSSSSNGHHGTKRSRPGSHGRRLSLESTSTVTEEPQSAELFKDFDDSVSVDDSNFQGDDEGSVADSYSEEVVAMEIRRLSKLEDSLGRDDDPNSSAALSRRAEEILLNAKKRLNNMEGNLTRARSSLYITPSGFMSSIHSSSPLSRPTPSPQNDPRILPQLGVPPAKHRQLDAAADISNSSPGHSRAYSENSIASGLRNTTFQIQSTGSGTQHVDRRQADSNRVSPPSNKVRSTSLDEVRSSYILSPLSATSPLHGVHLEPLAEDEAVAGFDADRASIRSALEDEFLDSSSEHRVLSRSTSSLQMRDLRDQMYDLKGRLSVLRDRARDDTMKRRSLQSLRTPSPFTAAEQWYSTDKSYVTPGLSTDAGVGHSSEDKVDIKSPSVNNNLPEVNGDTTTKAPDYTHSETASIYEEASENHDNVDKLTNNHEPEIRQVLQNGAYKKIAGDVEDVETSDDVDVYYDGVTNPDDIDTYESDSSIYHDATSISHEDREDAFDYEHFFLHSAMGTINQQRLERRGSFSSEDSADTARGPQADKTRPVSYLRSQSAASISTMNTFATANEGLESEIDDQEDQYDYAVQRAVAVPVSPITAEVVKRSTIIAVKSPHSGRGTPTETARPVSAIYNPEDQGVKAFHRPSVASFESFQSTGTTRSFPLVNRSKSRKSTSPISIFTANHSGQLNGAPSNGDRSQASPIQMLPREDQLLVEKLVATLGKCVLGLQEAPTGSPEAILWRRRLEEARKILDSED